MLEPTAGTVPHGHEETTRRRLMGPSQLSRRNGGGDETS